ncbi:MAG: phosphoenolpyruvate carboxykinase (GTP), partial [Betaproteobacteria bacterium]|nr:phosphoenolpyruvate carboxykinase (GTP) [Betaproteobacteria bacterium]
MIAGFSGPPQGIAPTALNCQVRGVDDGRPLEETLFMNHSSIAQNAALVAAPAARLHPDWVRHPRLIDWVEAIAALAQPRDILWCDGSEAQNQALCDQMVA